MNFNTRLSVHAILEFIFGSVFLRARLATSPFLNLKMLLEAATSAPFEQGGISSPSIWTREELNALSCDDRQC